MALSQTSLRIFQYAPRRQSRLATGMTLVEILIVLGLIVIMAAMTMPALSGTLEKQKLRSAAQQIQAVWNRTHVRAMKAGQVFVFRCALGGRNYEVIPWDADVTADDPNLAAASQGFGAPSSGGASSNFATSASAVVSGELPEGITFVEGDTLAEERAMSIETAMQNQSSRNVQWSRPVLFYADGLSSDAYLLLENRRHQGLKLTLRGMTGTSSLGDYIYVGGSK